MSKVAPKTIEQIERCDKSVYHSVSLQLSLNSEVVYKTKQLPYPAVKAVPFPLGSRGYPGDVPVVDLSKC